MNDSYRRDVLCGCLLFGLSIFFCWLEVGRFGIFGSAVDWISQHSVIPDYFRQQFYLTGDFFPEFAMGLGGGQNIYNFAYYGLYNPLLLPSYLLPFVKMGDYLMAVSMLAAASSAVIFYGWQRSQNRPGGISFFASLMLVLSGPIIFQSARQVMFVNYMPFLCMALWGVDRYFRRGKPGVYLWGVFLMIMTSFYYSVGGMLVLVIYGLYRYLWYREHPEALPEGVSFFSGKKWDAVRFLLPMLAAVLLSAFFLLPTAAALTGKRDSRAGIEAAQLLLPKLSLFCHLYGPYGIGLTTILITALISGFFRRERSSRVLICSSIAVLTIPVFRWLLNGGLYVRDKALIPFLPLFCDLIAGYCTKDEETFEEYRKESGVVPGKSKLWKKILTGSVPYAVTLFLLYRESGITIKACFSALVRLSERLQSGLHLTTSDLRMLVLLEGTLMLCWYIFFKGFCIRRKRKISGMLLVMPVLFLLLFGTSFQHALNIESREFYEQVTQRDIGKAIKKVLSDDTGFYRVEQIGSSAEQAANINRVWDARQYLSSLYSSAYNSNYQEFRMNTFDVEEPAGNFMMQRSSVNPIFQRLMGVRYLVRIWEKPEQAADKENCPFGYEWYLQKGRVAVYKNQKTVPICYAADRLISEETYESLEFPLNQAILAECTVIKNTEDGKQRENEIERITEKKNKIEEIRVTLPELETEEGGIKKTETGYQIHADKTLKIQAQLFDGDDTDGQKPADSRKLLYLQFQVKNQKPGKSLSVWVDGAQNTLSADPSGYFYYNHNTTFTYAVGLSGTSKEVSLVFGKGCYEITKVRAFTESVDEECNLYQTEFLPDWTKTKGDRISGQIDVQSKGYFVTSIPYDQGFEVEVDGKPCSKEMVNTAFLGFPIEEGHHTVEIVYHAPGAAAGKVISLLGVLVTVLLLTGKKRDRGNEIHAKI